MTPKQVLQMLKDKGAVMVDLKFIDLLGTWQHFTAPISEFKDEAPFEEGLGFDGSSIRGWQSIESSDMLVIPDPDSAAMDSIKDPDGHRVEFVEYEPTRCTPRRGATADDRRISTHLERVGIAVADKNRALNYFSDSLGLASYVELLPQGAAASLYFEVRNVRQATQLLAAEGSPTPIFWIPMARRSS